MTDVNGPGLITASMRILRVRDAVIEARHKGIHLTPDGIENLLMVVADEITKDEFNFYLIKTQGW